MFHCPATARRHLFDELSPDLIDLPLVVVEGLGTDGHPFDSCPFVRSELDQLHLVAAVLRCLRGIDKNRIRADRSHPARIIQEDLASAGRCQIPARGHQVLTGDIQRHRLGDLRHRVVEFRRPRPGTAGRFDVEQNPLRLRILRRLTQRILGRRSRSRPGHRRTIFRQHAIQIDVSNPVLDAIRLLPVKRRLMLLRPDFQVLESDRLSRGNQTRQPGRIDHQHIGELIDDQSRLQVDGFKCEWNQVHAAAPVVSELLPEPAGATS